MHPLKYMAAIGLLFIIIQSHSQQKQLSVGDKLPLLTLPNTINSKSGHLNFADYKGKAIIFDFWNQRCVPCIAAFPHLDSLQQQFGDEVQLILVNKESKDSTLNFFARRKKIKMPSLPMITGDTLLSSLFPTEGYPYHVWVDSQGTIAHFTGGYNTTAKHITDFLAGKSLKMKDPTYKKTKIQPGMMNTQDLKAKGPEYLSAISRCSDREEVNISYGEKIREGKSVLLSFYCFSALNLFKTAYSEKGKFSFETHYNLDFAIKDNYPYTLPTDKDLYDEWMDNYAYNYELILPAAKAAEGFKIMQQDLERYFDLHASVEMRKTKSLVVKRKWLSGGRQDVGLVGSSKPGSLVENDSAFYFINQPFSKLLYHLQGWISYDFPFFNECNDDFMINAAVRTSSVFPLNPEALMNDLELAGIELCFEEREIPVLFIRQSK